MGEEEFRDGLFDFQLYFLSDRACTFGWEESCLTDEWEEGYRIGEGDIFFLQASFQFFELLFRDRFDSNLAEWLEDERLAEAREELGTQCTPEFFEYAFFHTLKTMLEISGEVLVETDLRTLGEGMRADIGSEDNHRMTEVGLASFGIGEKSIFENLEEDICGVGMCFLDLVEENDGMGFATDFLR